MTTTGAKFAVIGDPVEHSISPEIHQMFANQHGNQIKYEKIRVNKASFESFVQDFFSNQGLGLNVTLPLKTENSHPGQKIYTLDRKFTLWTEN